MPKTFRRTAALFSLAATAFLTAISASAVPIYRNSTNDLTIRFQPGTLEVGDEILFTNSPMPTYITNFSFEYWGTNTANPFTFAGSVQARVRFYLNNGAPFNGYATPGTMFYDSGWFGGFGPSARSTLIFDAPGDFGTGLYLPGSDITWTVQFQGMGATDSIGLDLYSPPTVGQSIPAAGFEQDYWLNNSGWSLITATNNPPFNFGATFDATFEPVPEPSALALSVVGGLSLLAFSTKFRRK
jgi:hypothetical protein